MQGQPGGRQGGNISDRGFGMIGQNNSNNNNNAQQGFDLLRLSSPNLENVNEDFICSICQKILNNPRECSNTEQCG